MRLTVDFKPGDPAVQQALDALIPEDQREHISFQTTGRSVYVSHDEALSLLVEIDTIEPRLPNHTGACESLTYRDPKKCNCDFGKLHAVMGRYRNGNS